MLSNMIVDKHAELPRARSIMSETAIESRNRARSRQLCKQDMFLMFMYFKLYFCWLIIIFLIILQYTYVFTSNRQNDLRLLLKYVWANHYLNQLFESIVAYMRIRTIRVLVSSSSSSRTPLKKLPCYSRSSF